MSQLTFWKSLSRIPEVGAAAHDWELLLGDGWKSAPIRRTPAIAEMAIDPARPYRKLDIIEEGDDQFAAISHEPPFAEFPLSRKQTEAWVLDWEKIATELAPTLGFHPGRPGNDGSTRQIGTIHPPKQPVSPVYLHVPAGGFTDAMRLLEDLAALPPGTMFLPSRTLITEKVNLLAASRGFVLDSVVERLEASDAGSVQVRGMVKKPGGKKTSFDPLLDAAPDWTWAKLKITVDPVGRIELRYGRHRATHKFRTPNGKPASRSTEILLKIAVRGHWRNPPVHDRKNDADSKAFRRLSEMLRELVQIRGEPFDYSGKEYRPAFQLSLSAENEAAVRKYLLTSD